MDENFIFSLFLPTGALQTVKIIRNKASNASEGYGFVEFTTHAAAEDVLQTLNGTPIPNTDQIFRLNWAAFGVGKQTHEGTDNSMLPGNCELTLLPPAAAVEHNLDFTFCCSACGSLHLCGRPCAGSDRLHAARTFQAVLPFCTQCKGGHSLCIVLHNRRCSNMGRATKHTASFGLLRRAFVTKTVGRVGGGGGRWSMEVKRCNLHQSPCPLTPLLSDQLHCYSQPFG